jgi:hypothetical protein
MHEFIVGIIHVCLFIYLFMIYWATLLVAHSVTWNSEFNNEWERTWKEMVIVECEGLSRHFRGGTKENNENFIRDTRLLAEVGVRGLLYAYKKRTHYSGGCDVRRVNILFR